MELPEPLESLESAELAEPLELSEFPGYSESRILEEFAAAGLPEPVCAANSTVACMTIPELARVRVDCIEALLPPGDPRRDPFLSRVDGLFHAGSSSLMYLPSDYGLRSYKRVFRSSPVLSALRILDEKPRGGLRALVLFMAAVLLVVAGARPYKWHRLASALVWLPFVAGSSPGLVIFSFLVYLCSPWRFAGGHFAGWRFAERAWLRRVLRLTAGFAGYLAALAVLCFQYLNFPLTVFQVVSLLLAAVGSELVWLVPVNLNDSSSGDQTSRRKSRPGKSRSGNLSISRSMRRKEHRLFEPVSLKGAFTGRRNESLRAFYSENIFLGAAAALLLLFLPLGWISGGAGGFGAGGPGSAGAEAAVAKGAGEAFVLPVPGPSEGSFDSPESLARLFYSGAPDGLPDISSLLASRAYQESLLYGGTFAFPGTGDAVSLTSYREEDGRLRAVSEDVLVFDENWFRDVLASESLQGAGRLFMSLGAPAVLEYTEFGYAASKKSISRTLYQGIGVFALLTMVFSVMMPWMWYKTGWNSNTVFFPIRFLRRIQAA